MPIVSGIQARIRKDNIDPKRTPFSFRTGIHSGTVFKFTDANENLSFGGDGISLALRVARFGLEWHVFATAHAVQALMLTPELNRAVSVFLPDSDNEIEVINLHSNRPESSAYGNPSQPF